MQCSWLAHAPAGHHVHRITGDTEITHPPLLIEGRASAAHASGVRDTHTMPVSLQYAGTCGAYTPPIVFGQTCHANFKLFIWYTAQCERTNKLQRAIIWLCVHSLCPFFCVRFRLSVRCLHPNRTANATSFIRYDLFTRLRHWRAHVLHTRVLQSRKPTRAWAYIILFRWDCWYTWEPHARTTNARAARSSINVVYLPRAKTYH